MFRKGPWTLYNLPHTHRLNINPSLRLNLFHILNLHYTTKPNLMFRVIPRPNQPPSCNHNPTFRVQISLYLKSVPNLNLNHFPPPSLAANTPNLPPLAPCPQEPPPLTWAAPGQGEWVARLLCSSLMRSTILSQPVTEVGFQDVLHFCHTCLLHGQAASGKADAYNPILTLFNTSLNWQ